MTLPAAAAALLVWCVSCNAPRDNPLDPTRGGNLEGRVLTRRATPLVAARVTVSDAGRFVLSDSAGRFGIYGLPAESSWVIVRAQGYVPESARLAFALGVIDTMTASLNGLPWLQDYAVTNHISDRSWPPYPLASCSLLTSAGDADGITDLDSVWVEIPDLHQSLTLEYDPEQRRFAGGLSADDLAPDSSLEALAGKEVTFVVADREGMVVRADPCAATRIIHNAFPALVFPTEGGDTLQGETTFVWHSFRQGFWVRYRNQIDKVIEGGITKPAATLATTGPLDTSCRVDVSTLGDTGDFVWTVEAVDTFGNSTRSAEQLFHVR